MKIILLTAALAVSATALGFGTAQAQNVNPKELMGKTWNFKQGKISGKVTYRSSTVKAQFGGKTYNGKLRLKGDRICTAYKEIRKGKEDCFSFTKTKNGYKNSNGAVIW